MIDEEKAVHMVDIAPLIRGELKSILIPWIKAGSLGNFELRLANKVELVQGWDGALSCPCGYPHFEGCDENFCPKCGSEITKP